MLMQSVSVALTAMFLSIPVATADSFGGIGITIESKSGGRTKIVNVDPNGPAFAAGVISGEYIKAVDLKAVKGLSITKVAGLIRGPAGSMVTLTLTDKDESTSRDVSVQRVQYEITCFMSGNISLRLMGDKVNGSISGYIGTRYVYWSVFNGYIQRMEDGKMIYLRLEEFGGQDVLSGTINGTYVRWTGWNGYWSGYQNCILN